MEYKSEINNGILSLTLSGDLIGEVKGPELLEEVNNAINKEVILSTIDISNVRYINSSGIGVLITILTKFRNQGGEVCIVNPSEHVKKLLIITSDYHVVRVKEIFSFIYGKEYEIDVEGAYTSYCKDKKEGERKSLLAFHETFQNIEVGDSVMINKRLSSVHPFYNGDIYSQINF